MESKELRLPYLTDFEPNVDHVGENELLTDDDIRGMQLYLIDEI